MKKMIWILSGLILVYVVYFFGSLWWSGLDKGNGYSKNKLYYETMAHELDFKEIFAKHGATLVGTGWSYQGKGCTVLFVVADEATAMIPPEIEQYIQTHPDVVKDCQIIVEIMVDQGKELPHKVCREKTYFWWRILY